MPSDLPDKVSVQPMDGVLSVIQDYHARTKHHLDRYAAGPGSLDWDNQPNPFRHFEGTKQYPLELHADRLGTSYQQLYTPPVAPLVLSSEHLGVFFELSFAISAWKQYGGARWSLRCNPSSGNLHPTEAYAVLAHGIDSIPAGIYHYCSDDHALEQRCPLFTTQHAQGFLLGLSNIAWREAWKYGERAFRYCQLDTGHAIACADYAAACLGWKTHVIEATDEEISALLGLDRDDDFANVERETPELLLWVSTGDTESRPELSACIAQARQGQWQGQANLLDSRPMYEWPVIDDVIAASAKTEHDIAKPLVMPNTSVDVLPAQNANMAKLIRQRRSAQAYDGQTAMSTPDFSRLLSSLLPTRNFPVWRSWLYPTRIQPVFFVHRVEGLTPGVYIQIRDPNRLNELRELFNPKFDWAIPGEGEVQTQFEQLGFYHLVSANAQPAARKYACHQDIASESAFSVAMIAPFQEAINEAPWHYRQCYWEAGMLGQVMYMEAEASELRGTGIGCFFDDALHQILGMENESWQCLYQFTVGGALNDMRIISLPPYQNR